MFMNFMVVNVFIQSSEMNYEWTHVVSKPDLVFS